MNQLTRLALLVGLAGSLVAQTLSFGEITLVTPATTPPTYTVDVILTTSGTAAGVQFDLKYDPTQLNVTIAAGPSATAASKEVSATTLPAAFNPSTTLAADAGPGQRAIITGVGMSDTSVSSTGGPSLIADGVVATLTLQPTGSATSSGETLTLVGPYLGATTAGGLNVAAAPIALTIGAGSNDPGATGITNLYPTYLVGGVYPATSNSAPTFGSGTITLNDLVLELFAINNVPTYTPPCGSDRFDAMDTYPLDTPTTRGGLRNGTLSLNDLIVELFRLNNLPGYGVWPVRTSSPYTCTTDLTATVAGPNGRMMARRPPADTATLVIGPAAGVGSGQDRVPVYVQAGRDMSRVGVTFGLGDQQSQLRFQAAGFAPSLVQDSQTGIVAAAWTQGLDLRSGQQLLLGYVTGPAGFAANLKVFGASASGLDDFREVGLNVSGAAVVQR